MEWSKLLLWVRKKQVDGEDPVMPSPEEQHLVADIGKIWHTVETYKSDFEPDAEAALSRFKDRIKNDEHRVVEVTLLPRRNSKLKQLRRIAAAVAVVATLGLAGYYYLVNMTIELEVATTENEIKEVSLPDGTLVKLNENSSLSLTWRRIAGNERLVHFQGEAFFDVREDPGRPFVILAPHSETTVLGTSFNLRDLPEGSTADVEVLSGKVLFAANEQKVEVLPKSRALISASGDLTTRDASNLNADSWINKELNFKASPLKIVIEDIERHYQIQIKFAKEEMLECRFTTSFKETTLDNIFERLKLALELQVKELAPNEFLMTGGSCR